MQDDDQLVADQVEKFGKPKPRRNPPLKGWDDLRADAADIKDLLRTLTAVVARSDRQVESWPRPETALDRYEKKERKDNTNWLNQKLGISG